MNTVFAALICETSGRRIFNISMAARDAWSLWAYDNIQMLFMMSVLHRQERRIFVEKQGVSEYNPH